MDNQSLDLEQRLRAHLMAQYEGVFSPATITRHIQDYIDTTNAEAFADYLVSEGHVGRRMLDIGSGYGSIVLAARQRGLDAMGLEIAGFEVDYARARLRQVRPEDDPDAIYHQGDGMGLPFPAESFEVVTIMNVLEHVPDYRRLLAEAVRVVRPGGIIYLVCPNYAAFRREAHYLVPWFPLLPRPLANLYLRMLGRDPGFFEQHIHYCTNWGILRVLAMLPVRVGNQDLKKLENPLLIQNRVARAILAQCRRLGLLGLLRFLVRVRFYNPLKHSVNLFLTKDAS